MTRAAISQQLKWILATAIALVSMGCVERQSVSVSANGPAPAVSGAQVTPQMGAAVVGISTGGGWTLRARPSSVLIQGESVGAGLRLSPETGKAP